MPDWTEVLKEIVTVQQDHLGQAQQHQNLANQAFTVVRQKYLQELASHTSRNIIAYYSGFLSKPEYRSEINDEDKNGFMMAIHRMKTVSGLDLILHTPGGDIASTQSIVYYLREKFGNDIRAIVPQIAMSAGTMIACSCKEILMGKHSNLGPIDPHLNGIPAYGVIEEFKRAIKEIKHDPAKLAIWQSIISQYRPTFLGRCENAIKWSNRFVADQLRTVMFEGKTPIEKRRARQRASDVVGKLTDFTGNKTHARHIHIQELQAMGLKILPLESKGEEKLQDLVLTVHHCYIHLLTNTLAYKVIENNLGAAMIKNAAPKEAKGSLRGDLSGEPQTF